MNKRHYPDQPLLAVSIALWRDGQILLANRSDVPGKGAWALPGGLVELGETMEQAIVRETKEETALVITKPKFHGLSEIIEKDTFHAISRHYVLGVFAAVASHGNAIAGDDARAVSWFNIDDLPNEKLVGETLRFANETGAALNFGR